MFEPPVEVHELSAALRVQVAMVGPAKPGAHVHVKAPAPGVVMGGVTTLLA